MGRVCVVGPSNITPILPHLVQYIKANKSKTHTDSLRTPFLPPLVTFVFSLHYSLSFLSRRSPARIIIIITTVLLRRRHLLPLSPSFSTALSSSIITTKTRPSLFRIAVSSNIISTRVVSVSLPINRHHHLHFIASSSSPCVRL
ncbi:hypothetical protein RND81_02G119700 [Saponaria officinalis]|uniref:Uncharacterized protein n=1 Tax=Saponaria officinalis TaxID=3572 RepID=A0AAW1MPF4_SAPOF